MAEPLSVREEVPSNAAATLRKRLRDPDIAEELFFPLEHAAWDRGSYGLKARRASQARSQITGVRLHEWDRTRRDPTPELQCQADVGNLVQAVRRLRAAPGLAGLVLSEEVLACPQAEKTRGRRIRFGLRAKEHDRFVDDTKAAHLCHRRIVRAVWKSGYVVEHPKVFDPATGLAGLESFGREIRLRRRRRIWPWILPCLLLFLIPKCEQSPERFFGMSISTESLLLIVDKSSSMQKHFGAVKEEATRVLSNMRRQGGARYANLITYDNNAQSALGGLSEVDDRVVSDLTQRLEHLQAGGGTNLRSGLVLAAQEVLAHGRPTTLVILTDGEDASIAQMLAEESELLGRFKDIKIVGHSLTPRLFGAKGVGTPENDAEVKLERLSRVLKGRFGPEPEDS